VYYSDLTIRTGEFEAAEKWVEQLLKSAKLLNSDDLYCLALLNQAWLCLKTERFKECISSGKAALPLAKSKWVKVQVLIRIAQGYSELSDRSRSRSAFFRSEAQRFLAQSLELVPDIPAHVTAQILHSASEIEATLGNHHSAYMHLKRADELKSSIYTARVKNDVSSIRLILQSERKQHETNVARIEAEHLEKELTNSTLQLLAQTELLADLRDSLVQVVNRFPMSAEASRELREKLKVLSCKAVDWERFDTQFRAAHPEFTKALAEKYSKLTPTEVRMCSLLRMNMKSEDIARLLCLSERTIEVHRYNIRKKIGLAKQQDLTLFLARI
jgi:DNA-binding CsgD family transcriptional regulator